ncbi:MAG TPA: hypothetical protein VFA26_12670 [Gemmataceae bacterium]|nr:hypothetical protein [Gemmataceae bacterium]
MAWWRNLFRRKRPRRPEAVKPALGVELLETRCLLNGGSLFSPLYGGYSLGVDTNLTQYFAPSNALLQARIDAAGMSSLDAGAMPYNGPQFSQGYAIPYSQQDPPEWMANPFLRYNPQASEFVSNFASGIKNVFGAISSYEKADAYGLADNLRSLGENPLIQPAIDDFMRLNQAIGGYVQQGTDAAANWGNEHFGGLIDTLSTWGANALDWSGLNPYTPSVSVPYSLGMPDANDTSMNPGDAAFLDGSGSVGDPTAMNPYASIGYDDSAPPGGYQANSTTSDWGGDSSGYGTDYSSLMDSYQNALDAYSQWSD